MTVGRAAAPRALPVDPDADLAGVIGQVEQMLVGRGGVLAPTAAASQTPEPLESAPLPDGTAVLIATSGSSGAARQVALGAEALRHSAAATHAALGGEGRWVLAMPADRVGGFQVLVRSALSGTVPQRVAAGDGSGFSAAAFADAVERAAGGRDGRTYSAVVPTQLVRLLADPGGLAALRRLDAVLVGGAALSPSVRDRAATAGVRLVTTYGMTETAGGCVYDGVPLPGVEVSADDKGQLRIAGPVLALGYVGEPELTARRFRTDAGGRRWFGTDDLGRLDAGRLTLLGRADDVINTGGLKVAPSTVEAALTTLPGVAEAVVLGVADDEWGQRVGAVLVGGPAGPEVSTGLGAGAGVGELRQALRDLLPAHALPRQVLWVERLPALPSGKPDLTALRRLLQAGGGTMETRPGSAGQA